MDHTAPQTELLAPAGDWDSLRAAVANGADAVYLGLPRFNARQRAANFTADELEQVIDFLHGHNVRGYVTFNTIIFPDELPDAAGYVQAIAHSGADAVIVQDLGLAELIHRMAPSLPIHASTQMTLTEPRGIEFARSLGITRVILARELSLADIESIRRQTDMPLEVFVHGALCISVGGQCLASQVLFGRSGNRGQCGQPCRLPYELICAAGGSSREGDSSRERRLAGACPPASAGGSDKPFLLSPRDLAAHDRVARLVELGVAGLKIEGRMKGPTYVAAATAAYRAALDAAIAHRPVRLSDQQQRMLAQTFSRGWTHGYLDGVKHRELVDGRYGKSRGLFLGTVAGTTPGGVIVELDEGDAVPTKPADGRPWAAIRPGDGVVFDQGLPEEQEQGGRVYAVRPIRTGTGRGDAGTPGRGKEGRRGPASGLPFRDAKTGHRLVELEFARDQLRTSQIEIGTPVFKTDDPQLRKQIAATFSRDVIARREPIRVRVEAAIGRPVRLIVTDSAGRTAEVQSDDPMPRAVKHPLTVEQLREPFARLGNTPFEVTSIELAPPADAPAADTAVMAPKSVLNDLRRRAVEALVTLRRQGARHAIADPDALRRMRDAAVPVGGQLSDDVPSPVPQTRVGMCVLARTLQQLGVVLDWRRGQASDPLAAIYCDFRDDADSGAAVAACRREGVPVGLATTRIVKPGEDELLEQIARAEPDAVLVRNLAAVDFFSRRMPSAALIGDQSLNVANDLSAGRLLASGLGWITPALELSAARVAAMLQFVPPVRVEVVLYQHPAMFHTQYCLLAANLTDCRGCTSTTAQLGEGEKPGLPGGGRIQSNPAVLDSIGFWGSPGRETKRHGVFRFSSLPPPGSPGFSPPQPASCPWHTANPGDFRLRDRTGAQMPILCDAGGRNTIFASRPVSWDRHLPDLRRAGVRRFRVELLVEPLDAIGRLLDRCLAAVAGS